MDKATMSVTEMRRMLGLGKTDSYWLVHQGGFDTALVNGKIRVVVDSFEERYSMQTKHRKVTGEEPGLKLREDSYSAKEIAEMLGICKDQALDLIRRTGFPHFKVHSQFQISKADFERWYASQSHYVKQQEIEAIKKDLISIPQMAARLGVHRNNVYALLKTKANREVLVIVKIGKKEYVTKESLLCWLDNHPNRKKAPGKRTAFQLRKPKHCFHLW